LEIIMAIRARYDGLKRNPFNEAECGHHYARAMASWAAILALSGFEYSAVENHEVRQSIPSDALVLVKRCGLGHLEQTGNFQNTRDFES
jgi:hypothetical protein